MDRAVVGRRGRYTPILYRYSALSASGDMVSSVTPLPTAMPVGNPKAREKPALPVPVGTRVPGSILSRNKCTVTGEKQPTRRFAVLIFSKH